MLWDPSSDTWRGFNIRANSQMMVLSADLEQRSDLILGFSDEQQSSILEAASQL